MVTFQGAVYGFLYAFTEFFPLSSEVHLELVSYLLKWPKPEPVILGALHLGGLLALLFFLRDDLASMLSSVLQLLVYRKRPKTLDECLPFFILMSLLPLILIVLYFGNIQKQFHWSPQVLAISLIVTPLPLWIFDRLNRKSKAMYDWNTFDAVTVGIFQTLIVVPGFGNLAPTLTGAFLRNYNRETALKYSLYILLVVLGFHTLTELKATPFSSPQVMPGTTWLTYCVTVIVSTFFSLLALNIFTKHVEKKGMGQMITYRLITALLVFGFTWWNRYRS